MSHFRNDQRDGNRVDTRGSDGVGAQHPTEDEDERTGETSLATMQSKDEDAAEQQTSAAAAIKTATPSGSAAPAPASAPDQYSYQDWPRDSLSTPAISLLDPSHAVNHNRGLAPISHSSVPVAPQPPHQAQAFPQPLTLQVSQPLSAVVEDPELAEVSDALQVLMLEGQTPLQAARTLVERYNNELSAFVRDVEADVGDPTVLLVIARTKRTSSDTGYSHDLNATKAWRHFVSFFQHSARKDSRKVTACHIINRVW